MAKVWKVFDKLGCCMTNAKEIYGKSLGDV